MAQELFAVGAVEIRVAAIPFAALAEFDHGKSQEMTIGTIFFSPGCSVKRTAMAPASFSLALTHDVSLFCKRAVFREGAPDGFAVAVGEKLRLVGDFDAGRFQRGDGESGRPIRWRCRRRDCGRRRCLSSFRQSAMRSLTERL